MTLSVSHTFSSAIADDPTAAAAGEVLPSHWNAAHTLSGGTSGSVLFIGAGSALAQDNTNFFWDVAGAALKIGSGYTYNIGSFRGLYQVPHASGEHSWFEGDAGNLSVTGKANLGTGGGALANVSAGFNNTAVGSQALNLLTIGFNNFAFGTTALQHLIDGTDNVGMGVQVLQAMTSGASNVAVGHVALAALTSGTGNTAIGDQSAQALTGGGYNTFIGGRAGFALTGTCSYNCFVGQLTGFNFTGGDANTFLGYGAGYSLTGNCYQNTIVGGWLGPSASISNVIVISDGSQAATPQLDYNYTTASVWTFAFKIAVPGAANPVLTTTAAITSGAGAGAGTLTNAPAAGNPTKWIPINDNGTTRYIPAW